MDAARQLHCLMAADASQNPLDEAAYVFLLAADAELDAEACGENANYT